MFTEKPITFDRFVRLLLGLSLLVGAYYLLEQLSAVLLPFLLAWLTAYLLNPLVLLIKRLVKKNSIAVGLTLLLLFSALTLFLWVFIPLAVDEVVTLKSMLSTRVQNMDFPAWLPQNIWQQAEAYFNQLNVAALVQQEDVRDQAMNVLNTTWDAATQVFGAVGALFGIVTYMLYLIFLMLDYEQVSDGWKQYVPLKYKDFVLQLVDDLEEGMNGYFRAQTNIVIVVGILFAVGFKMIGLPFGVLLGISLGLMNYVPYLQLVGLIPAVALAGLHALETDSNFWMILGFVLLVFVVVQLAQDVYLTPKFMGDFSGFNPAIILLSLSIWGSLLGMIGLIIAIPLTSLLVSYYRKYIIKKTPME
jgi:predicted PurR-regulated permease PerM